MYESGELDTLSSFWLSVEQVEHAFRRHAGDLINSPTLSTEYVAFDVKRPPFDDNRIRQAFALANNRETLVDVSPTWSDVTPATGGFVPPAIPGHSPGIGLRFDRQRARQLLATAGFPDGKEFPAVRVLGNTGADEPLCEYLQTEWHKNLELKSNGRRLIGLIFLNRLVVGRRFP